MAYISLMEKALSAYSDEHIKNYFAQVKEQGLTEHGFPRLTANLGILISRGFRRDLLSVFIEMMDFCCENIPKVLAANNFSVREVICAIWELEKTDVVSKEKIDFWKNSLSTIDPYTCYSYSAKSEDEKIHTNWLIFSAVSEFFRQKAGLCQSDEFIDIQIATQLHYFDEMGMYKDNPNSPYHQPMVYDLVTRGLLILLLFSGYKGKFYKKIDEFLKKAGLFTLYMQSNSGELAFGGRSNQFIHNEAWLATILEYEAVRYKNSDPHLAGVFKAAAIKATKNAENWLNKKPIYHIKNRFPLESKFGCEDYAYFDKYMITAASFFYTAEMVKDDTITPVFEDTKPFVKTTTDAFHKVFACAENYYVEFDLNGDPDYDASGLGRVHRKNTPTPICLSLPCPKKPKYVINTNDDASLAVGIFKEDSPVFATDLTFNLENSKSDDNKAEFTLSVNLDQKKIFSTYTISDKGVDISISGYKNLCFMLPAFYFDGEKYTDISFDETSLSVNYEGYICKYTTNGRIVDNNKLASNRNGNYKIFYAQGNENLKVKIEIYEQLL